MNKNLAFIFCCFLYMTANILLAQTREDPVVLTISNGEDTVAPGKSSYVVIQLKLPYGLWMGAEPSVSRAPSGTKIHVPQIEGITFEEPQYPEPEEGWIPAKLGKSSIYKGIVNIVVPYRVDASVVKTSLVLPFEVTYTPGYSAGKLATHNRQKVSTTIKISKDYMGSGRLAPDPSTADVSSDYKVLPMEFNNYGPLNFITNEFDEDKGFTKFLHKIYRDKPGHGKNVRTMPVPFLRTTNLEGSSTGMGLSFFNSTKEGTMTGMVSMLGYANTLIGYGFGIEAVSCPGAYHNYQLSAYIGGEDYRFINFKYRNFTLANSSLGFDLTLTSINEPRDRFLGIGPRTVVEDMTAFERTTQGGIFDFYSLPLQNFRVGLGLGYHNYNIGRSFDDLIDEEGIGFLQDSDLAASTIGLDGGNAFSIRANFIYDHKDQEYVPSKGFHAKMTLYRTSLSGFADDVTVDNFVGLDLNASQYFSGPSQKLVFLLRGSLSLKSESDLPFYQLSNLGGQNTLRAYDPGRWLGQHSAFGSAELRYTLFTVPMLGYPMSIEVAGFVDAGQVFSEGDDFGDDFNVDPGFSIRILNKPNVGVIFNYAFGEDGGYLTGGIGLPF